MAAEYGRPLVLQIELRGENGEVLIPDATAPDVYLFDHVPTRDEARAGTNAMPGYHETAWTGAGNFRVVTFPSVPDPDPLGHTTSRSYYIGINFRLETGGQVQTVIRRFIITRATAQLSSLEVSQADLTAIDPSVDRVFGSGSAQLTAVNALVKRLIKTSLGNRGYRWEDITDAEDLRDAAIFMALHIAFLSQVRQTGDAADRKAAAYQKMGEDILSGVVLETDAAGASDETGSGGELVSTNRNVWEFDR